MQRKFQCGKDYGYAPVDLFCTWTEILFSTLSVLRVIHFTLTQTLLRPKPYFGQTLLRPVLLDQ